MYTFNEKQISKIKNPDFTAKELAEEFSCSSITIHRKRKQLDVMPGRGSKKGKPRPWQIKYFNRCKQCDKELKGPRKYCSKRCQFDDPEFIEKMKHFDKSYMQTEDYRNSCRKEDTPKYIRFKNYTHRLSEKIYQKYKNEINPNNLKRTLCGIEGGHQLDHILTIREGFDKNLSEEFLSRKENLRIITWKENLKRNKKIS